MRCSEQSGGLLFCLDGGIVGWDGLIDQATIMCGAERRTAMVVMMVNAVKVMRQNRSITIAANCAWEREESIL